MKAITKPEVLFLEIDGVLHPAWHGKYFPTFFLFSCADYLGLFLREFPLVEIVITSDWRLTHTVAEIRRMLPIELANRIRGFTSINSINLPKNREAEIVSWLEKYGMNTSFLILDTETSQFPNFGGNRNHFIACPSNKGFCPSVWEKFFIACLQLFTHQCQIISSKKSNADCVCFCQQPEMGFIKGTQ